MPAINAGMTRDSLLQLKLLDRAGPAAGLSRRDFEAIVGEDKILTRLRFMAGETGGQIGIRVGRLVGTEGLVLPVAVAHLLRIGCTPSGALFHYSVAHNGICSNETTVGVLGRLAFGIKLRGILDDGDHCAIRKRIPFLGSL